MKTLNVSFKLPLKDCTSVTCLLQDHDELVRVKEDCEKQLQEQKLALDEQKKRYEEMEVGLLLIE